LKAVNVTAGYGNGSTGGFRFRAMSDRDMDGGNIPVFDVMYNSDELFKVDIATGKIYFGEHFWYDPSADGGEGAIISTDEQMIIHANGRVEATNITAHNLKAIGGVFTGEINALSGVFSGEFDSSVIKTEKGTTSTVTLDLGSNRLPYPAIQTLLNAGFGIGSRSAVDIDNYATARWLVWTVENVGGHWHGATWYSSGQHQFLYLYDESNNIIDYCRRCTQTTGYNRLLAHALNNVDITTGGDKLFFVDLPTSSSGLESGRVWVDNGVLKIVP